MHDLSFLKICKMGLIPATYEHCDQIASIYNQYLGKATMDLELKDGGYYKKLLDRQDEMEELWVDVDTRVDCWGIIKRYSDRLGYRYTGETSVYCHSDKLNQGYGSRMKKHLMNRCRDLGYHHLIARIFADNKVSIDYNLKMGYSLVGIQKEAGYIDGDWKDVAILQYVFTE